MVEDLGVGTILDQPVRCDGECRRETAALARGDRDIRAIWPTSAQRTHALDVLVAGSDVNKLGMRLHDDIGAIGPQSQKARRIVIIILQLDRLQAGFDILATPFQQDTLLIGTSADDDAKAGSLIPVILLSFLTKKPCRPCR